MLRFIRMLFMIPNHKQKSSAVRNRNSTCYIYPKPYFTEDDYLKLRKKALRV